MKKSIILSVLIYFTSTVIVKSQNIIDLKLKKETIQNQIKILNDSLNIIDKKISILNSKNVLSQIQNVKINAIIKNGGKIKDAPNPLAKDIFIVNGEKNVFILDYVDEYFKICYDENCGYASTLWIESTPEITKYIENKKYIENEIRLENASRIAKQNELLDKKKEELLIKKYGLKTYNSLREGYYWIGMTTEMALIAFGKPNEINETVGSWGNHQQWVYNRTYLYFENGKLASYQR